MLSIFRENRSTSKICTVPSAWSADAHRPPVARTRSPLCAALARRRSALGNHGQIEQNHRKLASEIDGPIAALMSDLKQRGMFEDS